jgi:hypothetical protein
MKKLICSLLLLLFFQTTFASINVDHEFRKLNEIENFVLENPGTELADLDSALLEGITLHTDASAINTNMAKGMPVVGGFWWGCCLGVVGLALVYFISDNDRSQVRPAVWGCIISTLVFGGIYGFWNPFGW